MRRLLMGKGGLGRTVARQGPFVASSSKPGAFVLMPAWSRLPLVPVPVGKFVSVVAAKPCSARDKACRLALPGAERDPWAGVVGGLAAVAAVGAAGACEGVFTKAIASSAWGMAWFNKAGRAGAVAGAMACAAAGVVAGGEVGVSVAVGARAGAGVCLGVGVGASCPDFVACLGCEAVVGALCGLVLLALRVGDGAIGEEAAGGGCVRWALIQVGMGGGSGVGQVQTKARPSKACRPAAPVQASHLGLMRFMRRLGECGAWAGLHPRPCECGCADKSKARLWGRWAKSARPSR